MSGPEEPGVCLAPPGVSVEVPALLFLSLQFSFSVALEPLRSGWSPLLKMPVFPERESVSEKQRKHQAEVPWVWTSAFSLYQFMSSKKQTPKGGSKCNLIVGETPVDNKREGVEGNGRNFRFCDPGNKERRKGDWGRKSLALQHNSKIGSARPKRSL